MKASNRSTFNVVPITEFLYLMYRKEFVRAYFSLNITRTGKVKDTGFPLTTGGVNFHSLRTVLSAE